MKLSQVTRILATVGLAPVGRDHLMHLAGTEEGERFKDALLAVDAGDTSQRSVLSHIIASIIAVPSPTSTSAGTADSAAPSTHARTYNGAAAAHAPSPAPYLNFHVYGGSAALCISEATVRSSGARTIQIEAAGVLADGARRAFDWPNKIIVQLNEQEMLQALAVFMGKITAVSFDGHGHLHDKFLRIRRQDHSFFVEVGQLGKKLRGVPVGAPDASKITSLAYRQILANSPHLDAGIVGAMLEQVAMMHKDPATEQVTQRRPR